MSGTWVSVEDLQDKLNRKEQSVKARRENKIQKATQEVINNHNTFPNRMPWQPRKTEVLEDELTWDDDFTISLAQSYGDDVFDDIRKLRRLCDQSIDGTVFVTHEHSYLL